MSQPTTQPIAPEVSIDLPPDFTFGPTVLEPKATPVKKGTGGTNGTNGTVDANGSLEKKPVKFTSLEVLDNFRGTYSGFGFNNIFRPNSRKTPTPMQIAPTDNDDNVLELNLISETQKFSKQLGDVPNRGLFNEADISLNGVPYTQTILDITEIKPEGQPVIHFEPGLWMRVPSSTMPELAASFTRMASIPHGTTINAQCFQPAVTSPEEPSFPIRNITPRVVNSDGSLGPEVPFPSQKVINKDTRRIPQNLDRFDKAKTITQAILDDPNTVLRNANKGKKIVQHTTFTVTTSQKLPDLGGGTSNIGFLIGTDGGSQIVQTEDANGNPIVNKVSGNANAVTMEATYWISTVRATIHLKPWNRKGDLVSPAPGPLGDRDAIPKFKVDIDIPEAKTVTVEYKQIQYSQTVDLVFNSLSWPHVTVSTLAPIGQKLSLAILK